MHVRVKNAKVESSLKGFYLERGKSNGRVQFFEVNGLNVNLASKIAGK